MKSSSFDTKNKITSEKNLYETMISLIQQVGTTFVELIKRQGTYLGVVVGNGHTNDSSSAPPRITQLIPGSWAQRSDVLCTGDVIVGVNGLEADTLTREKLRQILDESDRYVWRKLMTLNVIRRKLRIFGCFLIRHKSINSFFILGYNLKLTINFLLLHHLETGNLTCNINYEE